MTVECSNRPRRPCDWPRGASTPGKGCSVSDATHETWKPIPSWEGLYEVSDLGRVRSLRGGRVLRTRMRRRYLAVTLSRAGNPRTFSVHRLVLASFRGSCPRGQQARHGPGGALDNRLVNLRYGTPAENAMDKIRDGTMSRFSPSGADNGNSKLTPAIVAECRECRAAGVTIAALARCHGVDASTMSVALSGKTWRQP